MEIVLILVLILLNGIFALAEIAVIAARPARLQERIQQGDAGAKRALALRKSPNRFLSTIQIGITLVGTLAGAFGGASVASRIAVPLRDIAWLAPYAEAVSVALVVLAITYLTLVLGELVPKRLALANPERLAAHLAPFLDSLSRITAPLVTLLTYSTTAVLFVLGVKSQEEPPVTDEEISLLLAEGAQAGVFEEVEGEMIEAIFRMSDQRSRTVMTPRHDIVWLDVEDPLEENLGRIRNSGYSRFPVCREELDDVLGLVYAKDLLRRELAKEPWSFREDLREPLYVPESLPALELLERFRDSKVHVALVIDEYGGVEGLITLHDVLESIIGDLPSEGDVVGPRIVTRENGSLLVDGDYPVDELSAQLRISELPERELVGYETVAGFMLAVLDRIPERGEAVNWDGWRFEVVDMDGLRIDQVLVEEAPQEDAPTQIADEG